jgi:peptidoglycan/LPS O-acetylase OafA/YrhL
MEIRRLNTLRGLAALIVAISHYSNASGIWEKKLGAGAGSIGVTLFFILSGFLMAYLYFGQTPNLKNVRNFAVARIARVIPLYYAIAIASYFLVKYGPAYSAPYAVCTEPILFSHLLFLHGESVLWTIPPEIQFYVLFALVWIFYGRFGRNAYCLVVLLLIADFFSGNHNDPIQIGELTFTADILKALPYFVAGSVMGTVYYRYKVPKEAKSQFYLLALAFIPMLYPALYIAITGKGYASWAETSLVLMLATIFFAVVFLIPDKNILLENPIGDFFGKISYSLYLLHLPVLSHLGQFELPASFSSLIIFLAAATAVATVSFYVIEAPSRKLIRRLLTKQAA